MKDVFTPRNNFNEWFENDWESDEYIKSTRGRSGNNHSSGKGNWKAILIVSIVILVLFVGSCAACMHDVKAADRCIVSGCKNKRQSSWTTYCSFHGCQYPLCGSKHQEGGLYCVEHTCKKQGCMERVRTFDGYCTEHKPEDKTCAVSGCRNDAVTGGKYCSYHTCDVEGCYYVAYTVLKSNYCSDRKCAYKDCPNKALSKGGMCEKHKGQKNPSTTDSKSNAGTKASGVKRYDPRKSDSSNTEEPDRSDPQSGSEKTNSSKDRDDAEALYEDYEDEFGDMDEAEEYWEEEYD